MRRQCRRVRVVLRSPPQRTVCTSRSTKSIHRRAHSIVSCPALVSTDARAHKRGARVPLRRYPVGGSILGPAGIGTFRKSNGRRRGHETVAVRPARGRGRASPIRNHERSPCHAAVLDIDDLVVDSDRFDTIARPLVGPRDPPSKANWNRTHRRRQDGCIPRPDRVHARDPPVAGSCRLGRGGARRHRRGRGADALHLEATDGATVPARGGTGLRVRVAAPSGSRADRERIASGDGRWGATPFRLGLWVEVSVNNKWLDRGVLVDLGDGLAFPL